MSSSSYTQILSPIASALAITVSGFLTAIVLTFFVISGLSTIDITPENNLVLLIGISVITQGIGFGLVAFGYLQYRSLGIEYLRIHIPTLSDIGWIVAGIIGLFLTLLTLGYLVTALNLPSPAEHQIADLGRESPELLLALVPLSFLVIGPGEELLFRGVIQTKLVGVFGEGTGIIVTSAIFALAHLTAYGGGSISVSIGILLVLSLILGTIYELSDNLVVPAIVHGMYNAILFLGLYASLTLEGSLATYAGVLVV